MCDWLKIVDCLRADARLIHNWALFSYSFSMASYRPAFHIPVTHEPPSPIKEEDDELTKFLQTMEEGNNAAGLLLTPDSQLLTPLRDYLINPLPGTGEYAAASSHPEGAAEVVMQEALTADDNKAKQPAKVKRQPDDLSSSDDDSEDQSPARMMSSPADPEERRMYQKKRVAENGRKHRERYQQAYRDPPALKKKLARLEDHVRRLEFEISMRDREIEVLRDVMKKK